MYMGIFPGRSGREADEKGRGPFELKISGHRQAGHLAWIWVCLDMAKLCRGQTGLRARDSGDLASILWGLVGVCVLTEKGVVLSMLAANDSMAGPNVSWYERWGMVGHGILAMGVCDWGGWGIFLLQGQWIF